MYTEKKLLTCASRPKNQAAMSAWGRGASHPQAELAPDRTNGYLPPPWNYS